jgi:DNA-binding response OmpR family regulator
MAQAGSLLLVEDDRALADALARGLRAENFEVTLVHDGADGLALAGDRHFDAIVLDLMLPGLNGFRFCRLLRQRGDLTPVLVLTAKEGEWDEAEALETGADDYLKKPFSFVVLLAHLRALLRRHAQGQRQTLIAGDLKLDPGGHRCWRGDAEIALAPREFSLLELLLRRAGQPVSRREILDEVWDWAAADGTNLVEVYIGYLRRKVDAPFGRRSIQTLRGRGYRLDPGG